MSDFGQFNRYSLTSKADIIRVYPESDSSNENFRLEKIK
jgi:hypothetical protein